MSETLENGSFTQRLLRYTVEIGLGTDGEQGTSKYVLPLGLRSSASVTKVGGRTLGSARVRISGLSLSLTNKISTLGQNARRLRRNKLMIEAGDRRDGLASIFVGEINEAWQDFQGSPETSLEIEAFAGLVDQLKPINPTSYRGTVAVDTIMADLAGRMGLLYENTGVKSFLTNPYYPGTAMTQAKDIARDADIEMTVDLGILAIWPRGTTRGDSMVLLNKHTGMVGYPTMGGQNNIKLECLFNKSLTRGSKVKVESLVEPANGVWSVVTLSHNLSAETAGGPWYTSIEAQRMDAGLQKR